MGAMMNEDRFGVCDITVNAESMSANTTEEHDFTVEGLAPGDFVMVNKPTHEAGLGIVGVRVKSANTLSITFGNFTGSGIDEASETFKLFWFRPEKTATRVNP